MNGSLLPSSWANTLLNEVAFKITDGSHNPPSRQLNGLPMLSARNVLNGSIVFDNYRLIDRKQFEEEYKRANVEAGDVLLTIVGTIGRASVVPPNLSIFTLQRSVALIKPVLIDSKWLSFYLQSGICQNYLKAAEKGTAQKGVYLYSIKSIPINLPPHAEQHRIVAKVEELFSSLDKGIETLRTAQQQLKIYRQAVLKWAFEGRLTNKNVETGELPKGWKWIKVNEISNVVRGGSPRPAGNPKYYNGNIPFLKVADITRDNRVFLDTFSYTIKEAGLHKTRKIKPNTLLLSNSGATLGVPKICMIEATMNDGIAAFLDLDERSNLYLYYFWLSKTRELRNINMGAAQPNLNTDIIKNYTIPYCSFQTQQAVVAKIESRLSVCHKIEKIIEQSLQQSEALRQSILKKAFEGKLVPQDPNDEPASVLLERIKAEREKNKAENSPPQQTGKTRAKKAKS